MHRKNINRLAVLASGSTGNAALLQNGRTNILIDAGISAKRLTEGLGAFNLAPEDLHGIVVTHEHSDHIKGLGVLLKKRSIPIFCSAGTAVAIANSFPHIANNIEVIDEFFDIGNIECQSFCVSHDAAQPVGYVFRAGKTKTGYCTDIGCIKPEVHAALYGCDWLVLESNHDPEMLRNGPYPMHLKRRIAGNKGHLSNYEAGGFISTLGMKCGSTVFLAHLSQENNSPVTALREVEQILTQHGLVGSAAISIKMTWPACIAAVELDV